MKYDIYANEWSGVCRACNTELYAPNKLAYLKQFSIHTHSKDCLGGW